MLAGMTFCILARMRRVLRTILENIIPGISDFREIFRSRESGEHEIFPEIFQIPGLKDSEESVSRHAESESDVGFPVRNEVPMERIMPTRISMRGEVGRTPARGAYGVHAPGRIPFPIGIVFESF